MNGLDVRRLEYFVAVAEEQHFGRAAERLHMTQPPLSRAVQQLEDELGVTLLRRTTRRVELTPAGEVLLRDARIALDAVAAAERRTRHAGQPSPSLRIALKADLDAGLLQGILAAFAEEPEACQTELVLVSIGEQAQTLRDGRADAAIVLAPYDDRGLDAVPLLSEPTLVAMAAPTRSRPATRCGWPIWRGTCCPADVRRISTLLALAALAALAVLAALAALATPAAQATCGRARTLRVATRSRT